MSEAVELVIRIPKKTWEAAKEYGHLDMCGIELSNAVIDGTPLPPGHGRLGDLDHYQKRLKAKYGECDAMTGSGISLAYEMAYGEDTVIEADNTTKTE